MKITRISQASVWRMLPLALGLALGLAACGGGGGDMPTPANPAPVVAAAPADSSGTITAFGSVFVNGHRFNTDAALLIDDDTGAVTHGVAGLEVGMVVDVKQDAPSTAATPVAAELHVHPLARGYVDAADATAGTLTVMGQTVALTSATTFSDHRACVSAATAPCTAITTAGGVVPTAVSGTTTTPGSYVTVHGYLFGGSAGSANIVATLVAVGDAPAGSGIANFKVEGVATVGTATLTIGALKIDLSKATCFAPARTACSSAFATGQVVAAGSAAAPALPATTLVADFARQAPRLPVETPGATVEVEGAVSSTGTSTFVVRGINVDASALPAGTVMPSTGDVVRVVGTIAGSGKSVTASSLTIVHAANSVNLGLEGDASDVAPASATNTFTLSVLGQKITVNAQTRLADVSVHGWDRKDPTANPFNITTLPSYLAASPSKHVVVRAESDAAGALVARSLAIVPASTEVAVAGIVDSTPAVVNSSATGTPTTFSVHGIAVKADPAAIASAPFMRPRALKTIAAGDQVVVVGLLNGSAITVGPTPSASNIVIDVGAPSPMHEDRGEF
jgi:hypothetical protein